MGSDPVGAEVYVDGARMGRTPVTLDLGNHRGYVVTFRAEGYDEVACVLSATTGTIWVVLDVLSGLVPVIVDAATGAWKSLDRSACNVVLPPRGRRAGAPPAASRAVPTTGTPTLHMSPSSPRSGSSSG